MVDDRIWKAGRQEVDYDYDYDYDYGKFSGLSPKSSPNWLHLFAILPP